MAEGSRCPECGTVLASPDDACSSCLDVAALDVHERPTDDAPADGAPETLVLARDRARVDEDAGGLAGQTIGDRYLVVGLVGRGGFGVVLRAMDQRLGRLVALKLLDRVRGADADDLQRFDREARILASLDHPGIIPVYDAGVDAGRSYIAMKLVRGQSLMRRIRVGRLSEGDALTVVHEVAAALQHAHGCGVLHRDIKPSNILEDGAGRHILADFGISSAGFLPRMTQRGSFLGTLEYLAPEVLSGRYSVATDLYGLGAVLHEMVFGVPCLVAEDPRQLLQMIVAVEPPLLDDPTVSVSPEVLGLLRRLLDKEPGGRPESAAELAAEVADLRRVGEGSGPWAPSRDAQFVSEGSYGDRLEQLERTLERVAELASATTVDPDAVLEKVSSLASSGARFVDFLEERCRADPEDPMLRATALSLCHIAHQVEGHVARAAARAGDATALESFSIRLQKSIGAPAKNLLLDIQRRTRPLPPDDFFGTDPLAVGDGPPARADWVEDVLAVDELRRHEAVLTVAGAGMDPFLDHLRARPRGERDRLLARLWDAADVLLLEARGRSRAVFEAAIALSGDDDLRERWQQLYLLFRKEAGCYMSVEEARAVLAGYGAAHRRVLARALLFHPSDPFRELALDILEPSDYWEVIAHGQTPVPWLLSIWRHLKPRVATGFLKVFLACARETLLSGDGPARVAAMVEMLKEFYQVDAFHENTFFNMIIELDERVRSAGRRHNLLVDLDAEYVDRFRRFLMKGPRQENPVEGWSRVPLPVQRLLARRGHFTKHFVSHPVDLIALECIAHIRRLENVTPFVSIYSINTHLLAEIAKDKHLFRREDARFALVSNPKAPAYVVMNYINHVRKDLLTKLAASRECNQLARVQAQRILARG